MSLTFFLKDNLNKLPVGVRFGSLLSRIPYSVRPGIGTSYSTATKDFFFYENNPQKRKEFIFEKVKKMTVHAYHNTTFYKKYYDDCQFDLNSLKSFADLASIPLTSKEILNSYDLSDISFLDKGRVLANTGGSSGAPFKFYTSSKSIGHEWAHIHIMWKKLGFVPSMLKLNFYGRNDVKNIVDYDLIRHSLVVDIYKDFDSVAKPLSKFLQLSNVNYLHGYPSALYEFACYCEANPKLKATVSEHLKGAFLTSEYPYEHYRNKIEEVFGIKTQSFYGHTERCIMAYETAKLKFKTLQTYGFAEVQDGNLIGTGYNHFATPLIRYNTDDRVDSYNLDDGILDTFSITRGRSGDFIVDSKGKNIALTGLVFGRHHKIFNFVSNLQIYQNKPGFATVFYCPKPNLPEFNVASLFDTSNVNISFDFVALKQPFKTVSGKVLLKVNDHHLKSISI